MGQIDITLPNDLPTVDNYDLIVRTYSGDIIPDVFGNGYKPIGDVMSESLPSDDFSIKGWLTNQKPTVIGAPGCWDGNLNRMPIAIGTYVESQPKDLSYLPFSSGQRLYVFGQPSWHSIL